MCAAEFDHGAGAVYTQFGLERSGFVINTGMNYAAVVAALMLSYAIFFFQQQQAKSRKSLADFERDGEADNAAADDRDVVAGISHDW